MPEVVKRHGAISTGAGVLVAIVVVCLASPGHAPFGIVLQGALFGSIIGLQALGLVLTYRSDRIVNFAYGSMGGVGGTIAAMLYLGQGWNWPLAVAAGLVSGALLGALTEILVIRRFAKSSRLILTVATIGLAQVLGGIQLLLPGWLGGPSLVGGFSTALSHHSLNVGPVLFTGNDLVTVLAVPIVIVALGWYLLRTDSGIAVRAIADNRDRALLLGVPVRRMATIVWTVAGLLATIAVILPAPSQGLTIDAAAGPSLLLPALAAAVLAYKESLPIAVVAGIGLGILQQLVAWNFTKASAPDVAFLIVILLALLLLPGQRGRREGAQETSLSAGGTAREIPAQLRRLPEVVAARLSGKVALLALVVFAPLAFDAPTVRIFSTTAIYAIVAVSLVLLTGWSGQVSLGQYAFVGFGGVLVGNLMNHWNLDFFVCLVAAAAAGAFLAVLVGLPALRIQGLDLAVTTLALAVAADAFFFNPTNFSSLIPNTITRPVLWKRFNLDLNTATSATNAERTLYFLCLGVLLVAIAIVVGLRRTRPGRVMIATRDNPRAAAAMAVPTTRIKLVGFVVAGAIAGIAGGLHAVIQTSIGYHTYEPAESLLVFSMVIIGGVDSIMGALLGVVLIEWAVYTWPQYQLVITGAALLFILQVLPGGLGSVVFALRDRLLKVVARRRGIDLTASADGAVSAAPVDDVSPAAKQEVSGALLRCDGVEASYGSMQVLFGVDLDVADGEIVALLGTNGAGKSTMLKAVAGLLSASPGKVWFDGADITKLSTEARAARGLSLVPAKSIFPSLNVAENLRVAAWLVRKDKTQIAAGRAKAFELFGQLADRERQLAGTMSGGQQQMLSLAMALQSKPKMLLIDELSLGLAPSVVGRLLEVVRELSADGVTIVIVEQSVSVALEVAERAEFLERGTVRFAGPTAELLERTDVLRSVFIGGAAADVMTSSNGRKPRKKSAKTTAKELAEIVARPTVLECFDVGKSFGAVRVLNDIGLQVHKGEIVGLIGHNGAGKTTLFDVICGFLPADAGRVVLGGSDVTDFGPSDRAIIGLGRSFQEARLFPGLSVAETVAVSLERHLESRDLVAAALRLPASTLSEAAASERVHELLALLGLSKYADTLVGELSTGTRRIVELACVMAQRPAVVLLDEPTAGVAQKETEALGPLLRKVRDETGATLLVIDHDMPLLTSLCDRLVALELGQVIAEGAPADVLDDERVVESYLGVAG
ncbi:MAG TPA: ATP-binding cassette domain-containing protein [Mycobacteriales bacterium]|jgi:ABC-type branched-subunit amino acid transport system ATPase component/ABC-type branched-subunit amino acid transport system permease subunit|nr:ATP-binding cassette domain-containing protein [Mycobacteriales bacterium]